MSAYIHNFLMLLSMICLATRAVLPLWCCTINEADCVAWTFSEGLRGMKHFVLKCGLMFSSTSHKKTPLASSIAVRLQEMSAYERWKMVEFSVGFILVRRVSPTFLNSSSTVNPWATSLSFTRLLSWLLRKLTYLFLFSFYPDQHR